MAILTLRRQPFEHEEYVRRHDTLMLLRERNSADVESYRLLRHIESLMERNSHPVKEVPKENGSLE
jgi:hypothetical protein